MPWHAATTSHSRRYSPVLLSSWRWRPAAAMGLRPRTRVGLSPLRRGGAEGVEGLAASRDAGLQASDFRCGLKTSDAGDAAITPDLVRVVVLLAALGAPVGDEHDPRVDQLRGVEHAPDVFLAPADEHRAPLGVFRGDRVHPVGVELVGYVGDDQVASWRGGRRGAGDDTRGVVVIWDVVQTRDEQLHHGLGEIQEL